MNAAMAQVSKRLKGDATCPVHTGKKVIFECTNYQTCHRALVCVDCVTSTHKGHTFRKISDCIPDKLYSIDSFINTFETHVIPTITSRIQHTVKEIDAIEEPHRHQMRVMVDHHRRIIEYIDMMFGQEENQLKLQLKKNKKNLGTYKTNLEKLHRDFEIRTKEYKQAMKSGVDVLVYDIEEDAQKNQNVNYPEVPKLITSHFVPCNDPITHLKGAFGDIQWLDREAEVCQVIGNPNTNTDRQLSQQPGQLQIKKTDQPQIRKAYDERRSSTRSLSRSGRFRSLFRRIIPSHADVYGARLKRITSTQLQEVRFICALSNRRILFVTRGGNPLRDTARLMDGSGSFQHKVELDMCIQDVCAHPVTGDIYFCVFRETSIRRMLPDLHYDNITSVFDVDDIPWCLAITVSSQCVVGMTDSICMLTLQGDVLFKCKTDYVPQRVFTCKISESIAVVCNRMVHVLNSNLENIFTYNGNSGCEEEGGENSKEERHLFSCAVFDDNLNLHVGDYINNKIHIVDCTGDFVQTIQQHEMTNVYCMCLRSKGVLWIGCMNPNKILLVQLVRK